MENPYCLSTVGISSSDLARSSRPAVYQAGCGDPDTKRRGQARMPPKSGGTSSWRLRASPQLELTLSDYCIKQNARPFGQAFRFSSGDRQDAAKGRRHFVVTLARHSSA